MRENLLLTDCLGAFGAQGAQQAAVAEAVAAIADASAQISALIAQGALAGITGEAIGDANADGDDQKDLDVRADQLIRHALRAVTYGALASEESEALVTGNSAALINIAYDPLDGSSNIETNISVGTIFSILPNESGVAPFSQPGSQQIAAGFVVYGPSTVLVLTLGAGVQAFTLDRSEAVYRLTNEDLSIASDCAEYAINASNARHWRAPVQAYINECLAGAQGPRGKNFNTRWNASLVAEVYRILIRGGVFLYPGDARPKYHDGRLRMLYEAHPMAMIVEQAGGSASTGTARVLDLCATTLHQRVPLILGARNEVARIDGLHAAVDTPAARVTVMA